jgi:hypothetical protein
MIDVTALILTFNKRGSKAGLRNETSCEREDDSN